MQLIERGREVICEIWLLFQICLRELLMPFKYKKEVLFFRSERIQGPLYIFRGVAFFTVPSGNIGMLLIRLFTCWISKEYLKMNEFFLILFFI